MSQFRDTSQKEHMIMSKRNNKKQQQMAGDQMPAQDPMQMADDNLADDSTTVGDAAEETASEEASGDAEGDTEETAVGDPADDDAK